jgi:hypothetical protein
MSEPKIIVGMSFEDFARTAVGYDTYLNDSLDAVMATK